MVQIIGKKTRYDMYFCVIFEGSFHVTIVYSFDTVNCIFWCLNRIFFYDILINSSALPLSRKCANELFQSRWLIASRLFFFRAREAPDYSAVPEVVDEQVDGAERYFRWADHARERRVKSDDCSDRYDDVNIDDRHGRNVCRGYVCHERPYKRQSVISGKHFAVKWRRGNGSCESERY